MFVTGGSQGATSYNDYATVAYDTATGAQLWVKRYNGPGNAYDSATSVASSPNGSKVFVTGYSAGSGSGYDYATIAYDAASGSQLWVERYNGPGNGDDLAAALRVSPDGKRVFVTGESAGSGSGSDYATIAYDASTGAQLWVARYNGSANSQDGAGSLAVSPDGTEVIVTGDSWAPSSLFDYATVAYAASTGAQKWVKRYNGPGNGDDVAHAVGISPDGAEVFVTGQSPGQIASDYATVAYDAATGAKLWTARYDGHAADYAQSLAVSPLGSEVFVTGASQGPSTGFDYATVAYDAATGAKLWVRRYNGPAGGDDEARSVTPSPDGATVVVTGESTGSGSGFDYATIGYNATTGAKLWIARYNGPGNDNDQAQSVGMSPDGALVFITGASSGSGSGSDYATVAYHAT